MSRVVCIVRHGQTVHNLQERCSGINEHPLTLVGQEQARLLGKALELYSAQRIISSDLFRAIQTTMNNWYGVTPGPPTEQNLAQPRFHHNS